MSIQASGSRGKSITVSQKTRLSFQRLEMVRGKISASMMKQLARNSHLKKTEKSKMTRPTKSRASGSISNSCSFENSDIGQ